MKKVLLSLMIIPAFSFSAFAEEKDSKRHKGIVSAIQVLDETAEELKNELKTMITKEGDKIDINKVLEVGEHVYELRQTAKILHIVEHYNKEKNNM